MWRWVGNCWRAALISCRYAPNRFSSSEVDTLYSLDAGGSARKPASPLSPYVATLQTALAAPVWRHCQPFNRWLGAQVGFSPRHHPSGSVKNRLQPPESRAADGTRALQVLLRFFLSRQNEFSPAPVKNKVPAGDRYGKDCSVARPVAP